MTVSDVTAPWKAGKYYGLEALTLIVSMERYDKNDRVQSYARNGLLRKLYDIYNNFGKFVCDCHF